MDFLRRKGVGGRECLVLRGVVRAGGLGHLYAYRVMECFELILYARGYQVTILRGRDLGRIGFLL